MKKWLPWIIGVLLVIVVFQTSFDFAKARWSQPWNFEGEIFLKTSGEKTEYEVEGSIATDQQPFKLELKLRVKD